MNHKTDMQADLKRIASELRAYNPAADEYKGEHIHKVWAREIEAALAGQSAGVPAGYALVPIEPTPEMVKSGSTSGGLGMDFHEWMGRITLAWRHMIAAAPAPDGQSPRVTEIVGELVEIGIDESGVGDLRVAVGNRDITISGLSGSETKVFAGALFNRVALSLCSADPAPVSATACPQPPVAINAPGIILTGAQLLEALDFIAPDRATDPDQLEGEVAFAYGEGHGGKAMYVWCAEYPEEGSFVCDGSSAIAAPKVEAAQGVAVEWADQARKALAPFASIGQWLFARSLPDDTPVVDVRGLNGQASALTRGMFKAAHMALSTAPSPDREQVGEATGLSYQSRALLLNVLWHHQGGRSTVGQPIRAMLGIGQHNRLTDEQLSEAKRIEGMLAWQETPDASPSRECGEQDCPHSVDDGACSLGVGCDETRICYAMAHGQPDQCGAASAPTLTDKQIKSVRFGACLLESQGWTRQAQAIRALLAKGE